MGLIKKYSLQNNIIFTGILNEKEMKQKFLESHIFVSSSAIENSPNSVGEAMVLGIPIISSYVGGVPDMIEHKKEGYLYQPDAPYMLAHYIDLLFSDDDTCELISKKC